METEKMVGLAASVFSALALLPQLRKIIKDREAGSISWLMLAGLFGSILLWGLYGILKKDWIIVGSNGISFIINFLIAIFTFKYKK